MRIPGAARRWCPVRGMRHAAGIAALALAGCGGEGQPDLEPTLDPVDRPAFDGTRAWNLVERQVAFGPRVPGTPGHAAQLEWMVELLRDRADTVVVDSFTWTTRAGEELSLANVRAVFEPREPRTDGRRLLFLAHWDTRPRSDNSSLPGADTIPVPGANDGGSGVAVLLELSRLLAERRAGVTIDLLLVDGEDYGPTGEDMYLGSRHFASHLPRGYAPAYGVLLDMVGDADPRFPVEVNSAELAPRVVERVWGIAQGMGYGAVFPLELGPRIEDDHLPLNAAGIPTVDVIDFTYGPGNAYWHTPEDVPSRVSALTLRMVGEVMAELAYRGG